MHDKVLRGISKKRLTKKGLHVHSKTVHTRPKVFVCVEKEIAGARAKAQWIVLKSTLTLTPPRSK